ncbi:hypothetical protein RHMOL_Rhmol01G0030900 [Rhododendron molle]|uniref:Uncharacterized protein n=1 Tax=Rhododendron molle TaxID=49168 RepID=A0ACC0PXD7_RHOML|nr:hypothetical protein RHMOL_Rhmol01G0030900 [Rhododendron molle]
MIIFLGSNQALRSELFRGKAIQRTTEMNSLTHQASIHSGDDNYNVLHQQRGLVMEPTMPLEVMSSILKRMKEGAYKSSPMLFDSDML